MIFGLAIGAPINSLIIKGISGILERMGLGIGVLACNLMLYMGAIAVAIGDPIIFFVNLNSRTCLRPRTSSPSTSYRRFSSLPIRRISMAEFTTLADYRGWEIVWHPGDHRLFVRRGSFNNHDFYERRRDRTTAIAIAKEWIDRR